MRCQKNTIITEKSTLVLQPWVNPQNLLSWISKTSIEDIQVKLNRLLSLWEFQITALWDILEHKTHNSIRILHSSQFVSCSSSAFKYVCNCVPWLFIFSQKWQPLHPHWAKYSEQVSGLCLRPSRSWESDFGCF